MDDVVSPPHIRMFHHLLRHSIISQIREAIVLCSGCGLVEQIWIYGNSYESTLVAVVVPDEKSFKSFAQQAGAQGSTIEELCKDPKVHNAIASPFQPDDRMIINI